MSVQGWVDMAVCVMEISSAHLVGCSTELPCKGLNFNLVTFGDVHSVVKANRITKNSFVGLVVASFLMPLGCQLNVCT